RVEAGHPLRECDCSPSIGPQPVERLDQRGLATAGFTPEEGPFAAPEAEPLADQERLAVPALMAEAHILDAEAEYGILRGVAEVALAGAAIEFDRILHAFDGLRQIDDPAAVCTQCRDCGHDVD